MDDHHSKSETIFDKPGAKTPIWQHFGITELIDRKSATRKLCGVEVPTKGGTTSCMWSHLKVHHHSEFSTLTCKRRGAGVGLVSSSKCSRADQSQENLESVLIEFDATPYTKNSEKWKNLTDYVTQCIADGNLSIDTIKKKEFHELLKKFNPKYELPDETYFTEIALPHLQSDRKNTIENELREVDFVAITVDMLNTAIGDGIHLNITCHFIDSEWKMQSRVLESSFFPGKTRVDLMDEYPEMFESKIIMKQLRSVLKNWSIDRKINAITFYVNELENCDDPFADCNIPCFRFQLLDTLKKTNIHLNDAFYLKFFQLGHLVLLPVTL